MGQEITGPDCVHLVFILNEMERSPQKVLNKECHDWILH